jgi:rubrerythrin
MANTIHQSTMTNGGLTIRPLTGEIEDVGHTGFMVGKYANQSGKTAEIPLAKFTPAAVRRFMEQHADALVNNPDLYVGTWVDKPNGLVYLDVSQKAETARQAVKLGEIQTQPSTTVRDPVTGEWPKAQKAVFDLKQGSDVPVGNLAEFLNGPEFQKRLDEMYTAGVPVMNGKEWWNLYGGPLERVYGKERVAPLAGFLASTSPASAPVHNLRSASEYLRRLIKNEPIIQPGFRIPDTAVGSRPGSMGAMTPGDFNAPGTQMPMEATRAPNLQRVEAAAHAPTEQEAQELYDKLQKDKVNDMFHALTGVDVGVYDRRFAKLAEDWDKGIFVSPTKDKVPGTMGTKSVSPYAQIENAVRTGAKSHNMPLGRFSAYVWEGIGDTIKRTGELYGMKHPAHTIPTTSQGFAGIFDQMVAEKAKAWGITVAEMEQRLRNGDAELLTGLLATPIGLAAYRRWQSVVDQPTD